MTESSPTISRSEFELYCRSVNGDLADIKLGMSNLDAKMEARHKEVMTHFDNVLGQETDYRRGDMKEARIDTAKALEVAQANLKDALSGTMSRSYAIIITVLTALCTGLIGSLVALLLTRAHV